MADLTIYLGNKNYASWSLRAWLALKRTTVAFEEVVVPLYQPASRETVLKYSPSGRLPALKHGELTVWDSLAICETLAERHPRGRLWPANTAKRAEARSISAEMHSGFQALRNALPMEIAARHPTRELDDSTKADIARVVEIWTTALSENGKNGGFLLGHFTVADAFYAPVATRFVTYGITLPRAASAYVKRILALPPMREWAKAAKQEAKASSG